MSPRHRQATEKQLAALTNARAALAKKHTCERCGDYDPSRGLLNLNISINAWMKQEMQHWQKQHRNTRSNP